MDHSTWVAGNPSLTNAVSQHLRYEYRR